jgi:hypothetical protein
MFHLVQMLNRIELLMYHFKFYKFKKNYLYLLFYQKISYSLNKYMIVKKYNHFPLVLNNSSFIIF